MAGEDEDPGAPPEPLAPVPTPDAPPEPPPAWPPEPPADPDGPSAPGGAGSDPAPGAPDLPLITPLITPEPPQPRRREPIVSPIPPKRRFGPLRALRWTLVGLAVLALLGPPVAVLAYTAIPPPITWLMIERLFQDQGLHKHWAPLGEIDSSLPNAVIAAEDQRFCEHHGFDFQAMQSALRANQRHPGKLRGGSTLSQQTAKNVFLWPGRDYVRKGLEAYFTVLIERLWGKRRIMEIYLNVVEWGPGTYGADAAARRYFNESAADLDPDEAAHLAAILPSPLKWKAVNPGRYVQKRSRRIGGAANAVRRDGLAACLQ